jgi:chromate transporter
MPARALEVFQIFLRLGVRSAGGPIAHIGYFREEFVVRRRWIEEAAFAELVGLCQFLPGPASSQVGFALGLMRGGQAGAIAAWLGFTLPSAVLMVLFAVAAPRLHGDLGGALIHALKLVAVPIVAQALLAMARTLTPDVRRAGIAVLATVLALFALGSLAQMAALLLGGLLGLILCTKVPPSGPPGSPIVVSRAIATGCLLAYLLLLSACALPPMLGLTGDSVFLAAFYRCGALVFGGGHVVLPLLRAGFVEPGWVSDAQFLSGYGAAQALPGPLFSFAAYLGFLAHSGPRGLPGAALGLVTLFLPGMLVLMGALHYWSRLTAMPRLQAVAHGIRAAVVGVLAAALYDPIGKSSILTLTDAGIALAGFALLALARARAWLVVIFTALATIAVTALCAALHRP